MKQDSGLKLSQWPWVIKVREIVAAHRSMSRGHDSEPSSDCRDIDHLAMLSPPAGCAASGFIDPILATLYQLA
jgi:hypothetical protein